MKEFIAVSTIGECSRMMQIFEMNNITYEMKLVKRDEEGEIDLSDYEGIVGNADGIYVFHVAEDNLERASYLCKYAERFFKFVTKKAA